MRLLATMVLGLAVLLRESSCSLDTQGPKCGEKRCSSLEYCSPFDTHCRPCAEACDVASHNYQPEECAKDCQEYLHDQRYVLRSELGLYEDLRGEVRRLRTLLTVAISITALMLLAILYLLARAFLRWDKICKLFRRIFAGSCWSKRSHRCSSSSSNSNNNNENVSGCKKKVHDDPEIGRTKQNGLKITMPTISASVAPSRTTGTNGNGTPNTTSTPLSRRHPSEDTTLDYAYDNPAMTPSPEAAQLRTKRESSF